MYMLCLQIEIEGQVVSGVQSSAMESENIIFKQEVEDIFMQDETTDRDTGCGNPNELSYLAHSDGLYICLTCQKSTYSVPEIEAHIYAEHANCSGADANEMKASELLEDMQNATSRLVEVEGKDSSELFDLIDCFSLKEENRSKGSEQIIVGSPGSKNGKSLRVCKLCGIAFVTEHGFYEHYDREHEPLSAKSYQCPECDSKFTTLEKFSWHLSCQHHMSMEDIEVDWEAVVNCYKVMKQNEFKCYQCRKVFLNASSLEVHMQRKHSGGEEDVDNAPPLLKEPSGPYGCPVCHKQFATENARLQHRYQTHKIYPCRLCNEDFRGHIALKSHVRSCHPGVPLSKVGTKQYICEYCSDTFADQKRLEDHIQCKHLGRIYECKTCGKILANADTLRIHQRMHRPELYRPCEYCGLLFLRLPSLMQHMCAEHPEKVPDKVQQQTCPFCNIHFTRNYALKKHIEEKHEYKTHTCDLCSKQFPCRRYLLRHKRKYHAK